MQISKDEAGQYFQQRKGNSTDAFQRAAKNSSMSRLDDEFYELTESLSALRVKFIRDHLDEFAAPS